MSVALKIYISIFLILCILSVGGVISYNSLLNVHDAHNKLIAQTLPLYFSLGEIRDASAKVFIESTELYAADYTDTEHISEITGEKDNYKKILVASQKKYLGIVNEFFPDEKQTAEDISILIDKFLTANDALFGLKKTATNSDEFLKASAEAEDLLGDLMKTIDTAFAHEEKEISERTNDIDAATDLSEWMYIGLAVVGIGIGIGVGIYLVRSILKPLKIFERVSKTVQQGDFSVRTQIHSKDEFGHLSAVFDQMVSNLQTNYGYEAYTKKLESEVEARTKELKDKIIELEKMQKLMVGRELVMMEMKKKMKDLEARAGSVEKS